MTEFSMDNRLFRVMGTGLGLSMSDICSNSGSTTRDQDNFVDYWINQGYNYNQRIPFNGKLITYIQNTNSKCFLEWLIEEGYVKEFTKPKFKIGDKFVKGKKDKTIYILVYDCEDDGYLYLLNTKTNILNFLGNGETKEEAVNGATEDGKFDGWTIKK